MLHRAALRGISLVFTALALVSPLTQAELLVYTAQLIRTMEPSLPTATAVAVEDGLIVAVGSEASLTPLVKAREGKVDRQFAEQIILPGFIDPHVHPALPAVLTQFPFLAPDDWSLPTFLKKFEKSPRVIGGSEGLTPGSSRSSSSSCPRLERLEVSQSDRNI